MVKLRHAALATLTVTTLTLGACSNDGDDNSASADNGTDANSSASENTESADSGSDDAASDAETIAIEDNHGTQEVPKDPQRVVATDNRSFEILDNWGVDLVAVSKPIVPFTVENYKDNDDITDTGNHREPNLEALTSENPDLIINGQRYQDHYDDIRTLNPDAAIIELEPRDDEPFDEELRRQVTTLGKALGHEEEAQKLVDDFDQAIERAKKAYDGESSVMAVNVSGGEIGYIAPSIGRTYGPIFDLLDLKPALEVDDASSNHEGDDISVEAIADSNPDWMFVLDREAGIDARNEADYVAAKDVIEGSAALQNVNALNDDHVLYAPEDTYTNENIITYTEILNDIADAFEAAKN